MVINIEPHFLLQGTTYGAGSSTTSSTADVGVANVNTNASTSTSNRKNENPNAPGYASDSSLEAEALEHMETEQKLRQRLEQGSKQRSKEPRADEWERNMSKKLRLEGKPYIGRIKHKDGTSSAIIRPGKIMGPPCNSVVCNGANCKRRCAQFSHEERKSIHRKFWRELNWEQRKMYVYAHVKVIKREDGNVTSKKQNTFTYCLTNSSNEKLIVCKTMFSNTLSLGHRQISNWTKSGSFGIPSAKPPKKVRVREKTEFPGYSDAKEYLESLPKQPSRGKDAGRVLENVYQKKDLYQSYVKYCELRGKTPTSHTTLCRVFGDLKLQLAKPRKDQQPARSGPSGQHRKETRAPNVARVPAPNDGLLALSSPPPSTLATNVAAAPVHPSPFFPQANQQAQYNPLNPYNPYYTTYNEAPRQEQNDQQQHHMHNRGFYSS